MTALMNELEGICEFSLENYVLEIPIIPLPCVSTQLLYHYGSGSGYQHFRYSYFINNNPDLDVHFLYKYIITSVEYVPDKLYSYHDGIYGKCWIVSIDDNENNKPIKYYIRNWIDIVEFYKQKGLEFIEEK